MMAMPQAIMAVKHEFSNGLYWELNGTTLTISGYGPIEDYKSPWEGQGAVEKVIIEDGVTSIGDVCFWEYQKPKYLQSVVIGKSVTRIGISAFKDCSRLTSISIPNTVKTIEGGAFEGCSDQITIHSLPFIVVSRGETEWSRIGLPKEAVYKYILAHRDDEDIRPIAIAREKEIIEDKLKSKGGYSKIELIQDGDKDYYLATKDYHHGLLDTNGLEIIPVELEALEQCGRGFLRFRVGSYWGVADYTGKIIIPTDRGYTRIGDYVSFTKRFPYEMDGYKGECNNLGQQVTKIKIATTQKTTTQTKSSPTAAAKSTTTTTARSTSALSKIRTINIVSRPKREKEGEYILLHCDNTSKLKQMAKAGNLLAMEVYCRQELFFIYTTDVTDGITNEIAEDVLPFLLTGAKDRNPNMEFMLACVLAGNKPIYDVGTGKSMKTPADYKYLDTNQSQEYFRRYFRNPRKEEVGYPFGLDEKDVRRLALQAFPDFESKPIESVAPKFGFG